MASTDGPSAIGSHASRLSNPYPRVGDWPVPGMIPSLSNGYAIYASPCHRAHRARPGRHAGLHQGRRSDPAAELPDMPPAGPGGAVLSSDIRAGAAVGEGHQIRRPAEEDATLVRRPEVRNLLER